MVAQETEARAMTDVDYEAQYTALLNMVKGMRRAVNRDHRVAHQPNCWTMHPACALDKLLLVAAAQKTAAHHE